MNAQMNSLLEQLRTQFIAEAEDETAFGPDSEQDSETGEGEPGELGAKNVTDGFDAFDLYMDDIVLDLLDEYELDDNDAIDFVFSIADELADEGKLPFIPEEDDEKALTDWLGKAKTLGFEAIVLARAEAAAEG